jgi:Amt family ammonium transporter
VLKSKERKNALVLIEGIYSLDGDMAKLAAPPSYYALLWRTRTRLDDSLDVVAAHGLGGLVGALLTGVFAAEAWGGATGLLAGNAGQLGAQALAALAVAVYSGVVTFGLLKLVGAVIPLRVSKQEEGIGLDVSEHGEEAYGSGEGAILVLPATNSATTAVAAQGMETEGGRA